MHPNNGYFAQMSNFVEANVSVPSKIKHFSCDLGILKLELEQLRMKMHILFPQLEHEGRHCSEKNWGAEERDNLFLLQ